MAAHCPRPHVLQSVLPAAAVVTADVSDVRSCDSILYCLTIACNLILEPFCRNDCLCLSACRMTGTDRTAGFFTYLQSTSGNCVHAQWKCCTSFSRCTVQLYILSRTVKRLCITAKQVHLFKVGSGSDLQRCLFLVSGERYGRHYIKGAVQSTSRG